MAHIRLEETAVIPTPPAGYVSLFMDGGDTWQKDANGLLTNLTSSGLTAVNLGVTLAAGEVVITNDAGTDATIPLATDSLAGAAAPETNSRAASAVQSVVAGANVTVDNTDPQNPIVSATDAVGVESVTGGAGVTVDNTDPANPIVSSPEAASAVQSVTGAAGVTVDNTDPQNPVVSSPEAASAVQSVVAGVNVTVDNTDPQNPIVSSTDTGQIIYDGVDTQANILAIDPATVTGQLWWAFDTKTAFEALANAWQPVQMKYNVSTDTFFATITQDGHMLDFGQETFFPASNTTASGATALDPKVFESVGADATDSEFQEVRLAVAGDLSEGSVFGLNTTSLLAGERGKIVTYGQVRDVNTSAWAVNDTLYVDTTAGELTNVQPEINAYTVGRVLKSDALEGIIFVQSLAASRVDVAVLPVGVSFIYLTGETEITPEGTFYKQLLEDEGTVATATETAAAGDNATVPIGQDHIGDILPADTTLFGGIRKAQLEFSVDSGSANEKLYIELYQADADGAPVDSGIVTEPVGALGVRPILTFESSLLNSDAGDTYKPELRGLLSEDYVIPSGTRTRSHVLVEKVGTAGGNKTFTVYYGSDHDSFLESLAQITIDDVIGLPEALDATLKAGGLWSADGSLKNTMYRENGWLGWPLVDTDDHLEPQVSGPAEDSIDTSEPFPTASNVSIVTVTHTLTIVEDCQVLGLSVYVPNWDADTQTEITLFNQTTGEAEIITNLILDPSGFTTLRASQSIFLAGQIITIELSAYNSTPANAIDGGWTSNTAGGVPASQAYTLDNATTSTLR